MRLFKQAAKLGSLPAYGCIGMMYEYGNGVREDKNKALEFYKEGARKGSAYCYWAMAMLFKDEDNDRNAEKCFALFLKNKPKKLPDDQRLTVDELNNEVFRNCVYFAIRQLDGRDSIPSVLNDFIIDNLSEIIIYFKCGAMESLTIQEYEPIVQYLESLAKA